MTSSVRIGVIGSGVAGLTAAYDLRRQLGGAAVIEVLSTADVPGGLLATASVAGRSVDVGAEAFIIRRPEALALVTELGLADQVRSPGPLRPAVWSAGGLHHLPAPAVMGIPANGEALGKLVGDADLQQVATEADRRFAWTPGSDVSVGELVAERFGPAVVARSVDPMLGGVYSARAADLGLRDTIPALAAALDAGAASLTDAVTQVLGTATGSGPVFGALDGGYRVLVAALVRGAGALMRGGITVNAVRRDGARYVLATDDGDQIYDAVVVAVPIWTAGHLLRDVAPDTASTLRSVRAAGSAVVAFAVTADTALPEHSGVLVASDADDLAIKAITLSSRKWPHLAATDGGVHLLRTSIGRLDEPVPADDADLIARSRADLATVWSSLGLAAPDVVDAVVQRWPEGLPQYAPGHLATVAQATQGLPSGLAVAGSGYRGVGVPACISSARAAAQSVARHLMATD